MQDFEKETRVRLSRGIKEEAVRIGFDACGISEAGRLDEESRRLEDWLLAGRHGSMSWMEGHFEKRTNPKLLVDGARSVVSVLHNYYHSYQSSDDPNIGRISRYAWGDDYHDVMKRKLRSLLSWLDEEAGGVKGRVFVDSAPVLDKAWAARAGLGWIGKHSNLISTEIGSWFFIGELIVDLPLDPDEPIADHCGTCTLCIDACPTDAIVEPYVVDANRCISYLTIEHREDDVAQDLRDEMGNWIFGCDICQDVCPWNKFRRTSGETAYRPREGTLDTTLSEWAEIDEASFRSRFKSSPVKRPKWEGFVRNVRYALANAEGNVESTMKLDPVLELPTMAEAAANQEGE